jgi:hypothetical protein
MFQPEDASSPAMQRRYLLALVVESIVLVGLWALGRIYS